MGYKFLELLYESFSFLLKNFIFVGNEFLELHYESFSPLLKIFIFVGYEFLELGSRYIIIKKDKKVCKISEKVTIQDLYNNVTETASFIQLRILGKD